MVVSPLGGQNIMKIPPRRVRRAKDRVERAKLLIAAVRDRAVEKTAQQRAEPSMKRRPALA